MRSRQDVALVTGGGVRIGRAIVDRLASDGYAVAVHSRACSVEAREAVDRIVASGGRAVAVDGDLADPSALGTILPRVRDRLGPVTLLVNNASAFERDDVDTLDERLWDLHLDVNLRAPVFLTRDMARLLPRDRRGCVVNIIDQRVWKLTPQFLSYTIAKAGLWTATRTLAQALAPRIRVNAVGPGPTLRNVRQTAEDFTMQADRVPLGRAVAPSELADAVLFLARATGVTAQMIAVDAGQHIAWQTPDVCGVSE
jgi:NAD(P)-dependent dehydrogenase (short-subunit alcohol dehydrogenase family)